MPLYSNKQNTSIKGIFNVQVQPLYRLYLTVEEEKRKEDTQFNQFFYVLCLHRRCVPPPTPQNCNGGTNILKKIIVSLLSLVSF